MNKTLLIGILGAAGVYIFLTRNKAPVRNSAPAAAVSGPAPTGINDYLRNYLPAGARQYLPAGQNGPVKITKDNTVGLITAGVDAAKSLYKDPPSWLTGKPGTPATYPDWNPNDPAQYNQYDTVPQTGSPYDWNSDVGPNVQDSFVPDTAPAYSDFEFA